MTSFGFPLNIIIYQAQWLALRGSNTNYRNRCANPIRFISQFSQVYSQLAFVSTKLRQLFSAFYTAHSGNATNTHEKTRIADK